MPNKPRFVSHFPDSTVRVYDIYGDEIPDYAGKKYDDVARLIESAAGRPGVIHRQIKE